MLELYSRLAERHADCEDVREMEDIEMKIAKRRSNVRRREKS